MCDTQSVRVREGVHAWSLQGDVPNTFQNKKDKCIIFILTFPILLPLFAPRPYDAQVDEKMTLISRNLQVRIDLYPYNSFKVHVTSCSRRHLLTLRLSPHGTLASQHRRDAVLLLPVPWFLLPIPPLHRSFFVLFPLLVVKYLYLFGPVFFTVHNECRRSANVKSWRKFWWKRSATSRFTGVRAFCAYLCEYVVYD